MNSKEILAEIEILSSKLDTINIMEVCGTHTQVIAQYGLREVLPDNINLITGPGCPVCVTAQEDIDNIVELALAGIPIVSYGDIMRVPGNKMSLDQAREQGAKVFTVYSIEEALTIQKTEPNLVFFAFGFETTTPMTVYGLQNGLTIYNTHKLFIPVFKTLIEMGEINIDGFLGPGHVSTITGIRAYQVFNNQAIVITGFELKDVLEGILLIIKQLINKEHKVENQYTRAVFYEGNQLACQKMMEIFEINSANWRGFGDIAGTGLKLKNQFINQDAKIKYQDILAQKDIIINHKLKACACGQVIKGLQTPQQCPLFAKICNPNDPQGPCMVSQEGACNVAYRYSRLEN